MGIYGHRHLGFFFRPVVEVNERGLRFKGRDYGWITIRKLEVHDSPIDPILGFSTPGYPWATVYFSDGERLRLNGRALEKQGEKPTISFFSQKSNAFQELIVALKAHATTITPSANEMVLQWIKLIPLALLGIFVIFAILGYLDARL